MIAGKTPFQGNSLVETLANLINSELQPLALYDANLPDEFDRIVSKMLKKSAGERYQKMEDLLVDLRTLQRRLDFEAETGRTSPPNKQIETARGGQITVDKKDEKEAKIEKSGFLPEKSALRKYGFVLAVSAFIIIALTLGALYLRQPNTRQTTDAQIRSIAVLPLKNLTGDAANDYLCDGMAESLIAALSKIENLTVIASNSSFTYKEKEIDFTEIGQKLNVETVLAGSVQKEGDAFRAVVRLVNSPDGRVIWTTETHEPASEIFLLQNEIARSVSARLKPQAVEKISRQQTDNKQAYELYLKGRYFWNKRSPDDLQKSVEYFNQAIALDPQFALAYAGLANSY